MAHEPTLQDLSTALQELNQSFPRPGIPPLSLAEPYDLQHDWPESWPNAEFAGVYAMLDDAKTLLYIKKSSFGAGIGARLGAWFGYGPNREASPKHEALKVVRYVVTLGVPKGHEFEAPAIEEFLIGRLHPALNKVGVSPKS